MSNKIQSIRYIIRVTNYLGDVLYVDRVRKSFRRCGFSVKIRQYAKQFPTKEAAEAAIKTFKSLEAPYAATFTVERL